MTVFRWLHFTDLHLGLSEIREYWPNLQELLFEDLDYLCRNVGPWDAVLFTGDLVQKGAREEFADLDTLLSQFWEKFRSWGFTPSLLACPGNHDLRRPSAINPAVVALVRSWGATEVNTPFWNDPGSEYRKLLQEAFANYQDWWTTTKLPKPDCQAGLLPGDFSATLEKDSLSLGIVGLNSAFLHLVEGDREGKLALDIRQFNGACGGDGASWTRQRDACLLMTHHPPTWLDPRSRDLLHGEIHSPPTRFVQHLFGHMHEARALSQSYGGGEPRRILQGCSLFSFLPLEAKEASVRREHGYSLVELTIDDDRPELRMWPRHAEEKQGGGRMIERDPAFPLDKGDGGTREAVALPNFRGRARAGRIAGGAPGASVGPVNLEAPAFDKIARHLSLGRIIPFLGPTVSRVKPGAKPPLHPPELAELVATRAGFPPEEPEYVRRDLAQVASYYARVDRVDLDDLMKDVFQQRPTPGPLHLRLATNPGPLLLITTNYDTLLERAFEQSNQQFHLVVGRGHNVLHRPPGEKGFVEIEASKLDLFAETVKCSIIYKMWGDADGPGFFVTEEDHVKLLGAAGLIPPCFVDAIRRTRFLFLGFGLQSWNFRVMLRQLNDLAPETMKRSFAFQSGLSQAEDDLWRSHQVRCFDLERLRLGFDTLAQRLVDAEAAASGKS
jgi:hypothetical protein